MVFRNFNVGNKAPIPPLPKSESDIISNWTGEISYPAVSIICITYNHVDFIENTLNGILMQETTFPFEVILHDDASNDGTTEIVKRYASQYPNIIVPIIQTENQWSKGNRPSKYTYPVTKGKYIAICEGDDYWLDSYKIAKQFLALEEDKSAVIAYHHAVCIDRDGLVIGHNKVNEKGYSKETLKKAPFIPTLTRFYRNIENPWLSDTSTPIASDIIQTSYFSRFGGAKFVGGITPAVYRQHVGGVWSKKSQITQSRLSIDALLFIADKYDMEDDSKGRLYFLDRAILKGLDNANTKEIVYIATNVIRYTFKKLMKAGRRKIKRFLRADNKTAP